MKHDSLIRWAAALAVSLSGSVSTVAQDVDFDTLTESEQVVTLDVVTVVATKTPQDEEELLSSVDTISGAELKQRQLFSTNDVLRRTAGTSVVNLGQEGSQTSFFVRGTESNHTVVLLNGRRLPPGLAGQYQLEFLDASLLDSVQLHRGPISSLYGSDALGGALDLRSTDARFVESNGGSFYTEAGSFDTFRSGGEIHFRDGIVGGVLEASTTSTSNDRPLSDYDNSTFRGNLAIDIADGVWIDLLGYIQSSRVGVPGASTGFQFPVNRENSNQSSLFSPRLTIERDAWDFSLFYSYTENQLEDENSPPPFVVDSRFEQVGHEAEAIFNYHPTETANHSLGAGHYSYSFDRNPLNQSFALPASNAYAYTSVFGQTDLDLPQGFGFLGSIRHDAHDSYRDATTYSLQLSKELEATGTSFFVKKSTGYKAPSGQDLLFLNPTINPATLQPEESDSWEYGIRQQLPDGLGTISVARFQSDITNLIDNNPATFAFSQVDSQAKGFEVEVNLQPSDGLTLYANYTYLDAKVVNGAGFTGLPGQRLLRRPRHSAHAGMVLSGDRWDLGLEMQGYYDRLDIDSALFTRTQLDDYTIARIFGSFDVSDTIEIYGRVENALDQEYQSSHGFEGSGLGVFGGVRIQFGK